MKYRYVETIGSIVLPLVVTRFDIERTVCTSDMTTDERNSAVDAYLTRKGATAFSDLSMNEYQGMIGEPNPHAAELPDEEITRMRKEIGALLREGARLANLLGSSLSDVVEREHFGLKYPD